MSAFTPVATIPVGNTLGECILWDERTQCAWWTDIHESTLYRYHDRTGTLERFACPERLCSFGFVEDGTRLVCAFASGFALFDPSSGERRWLWQPELGYRGTRFNDGRVDRQGRFWAGTMVEGEARDGEGRPARGSLYRIAGAGTGTGARAGTGARTSGGGSTTVAGSGVLGDIGISNSLCFSPDGTVLYFADSPTRRIRAFTLDPRSGEPTRERLFAEVSGEGAPDGSTVDAEGFLWNAQWGGSKVVRYTPAGQIDCELELPVSQPTCVCFGGENLDRLFVSSARESLGEERRAAEPDAGHVLVYRTPFRGLPESRYRP